MTEPADGSEQAPPDEPVDDGTLARCLDVESQSGCIGLYPEGVENRLLGGEGLTGNGDFAHRQPGFGKATLGQGRERADTGPYGLVHRKEADSAGKKPCD